MTKNPRRRLPIHCDDDTARYDYRVGAEDPQQPKGIDADGAGSKSGADVQRPEGGESEDQSATRR
jgi:hypothetical protein